MYDYFENLFFIGYADLNINMDIYINHVSLASENYETLLQGSDFSNLNTQKVKLEKHISSYLTSAWYFNNFGNFSKMFLDIECKVGSDGRNCPSAYLIPTELFLTLTLRRAVNSLWSTQKRSKLNLNNIIIL